MFKINTESAKKSRTPTYVGLPVEIREKLNELAARNGVSQNEIIVQMIKFCIENVEPKKD